MIIYICDEEHADTLRDITDSHEWDMTDDQLRGNSLSDYISERLQFITNLTYLIIDRTQITDSEKELNETIETLKCMYELQVIVLETDLVDEEGDHRNVVYRQWYTSLLLSDDHMWKNLECLLLGQSIPEELEREGIWIGVMSSNSGAGATAFSVGLAEYIYQYDASVCYVEANESGDLAALAGYYEIEKVEENHYQRNGMDYWHQSIDQTKKYVVIDLGRYTANKLKVLEQCTVKVLITDSKPYRMADAWNVYRYINDEKTRVCLNYGNKEVYQKIRDQYFNHIPYVLGMSSEHYNLFDTRDPVYTVLMQGYLHLEEQSRFAFMVSPAKLKNLWKKRKNSKAANDKMIGDEDLPDKNMDEEQACEDQEDSIESVMEEDDSSVEIEEIPIMIEENTFDSKSGKKHISTMLLILGIIGTGTIGVLAGSLIKEHNMFSFTNQQTQTDTMIDEDLNINPDIKISVLEVEGADGYEVSYSTDKDFPKERTVVVEVETADKAVESLAADKTYYVRVRAYKVREDGTKVYGEYTDVQKIHT